MSRYLTLFGILLFLAPPVALPAQSESPAVRRAREVVALINSADVAAVRAYADTALGSEMREMPLEAHVDFVFGQREMSRGLDWQGIQEEEPGRAVALLKRRLTGDWAAIGVRVEAEAPYRITGIGLRQPRPPAGVEPVSIADDAEMVRRLERYLATLADADLFSGSVLLARDGKILFEHAYGVANRDFGVPNRSDTKFNLGSMNKMFTAVAIAQLVERGKLSFDDPLARFLPDFPNPDAAQKILIRHLLTHTSGLGSYFNDEFERSSRLRFRTVDDMMRLAENESLSFEPGTRWSYSNTGMLVLGKVIEVVTGRDYFEWIRENVYAPAAMPNTDAYELDLVNPNLAVGYDREYLADGTKRFRNNIFAHVLRGGPAGGGYSTAGDLFRFAEALKGGKLVGAAYVKLLTTAKPEANSPRYGYGFTVSPDGKIVGHSGGFAGISSNLDIFLDSGYVAVVLSNDGMASLPVVEKIRELMRAAGR